MPEFFLAIVKEQAKRTSQTRWYCEFEFVISYLQTGPRCVNFSLHVCVQDGVCVASASPALHMHDHDINLRVELAAL